MHAIPLDDAAAKSFIDLDGKGADEEAQRLLGEQKAMTRPDRAWKVRWAPGKGIDANSPDRRQYLEDFCLAFAQACVGSLEPEQALANEMQPDRVVEEAARHLAFVSARARKFHDTSTAVRALERAAETTCAQASAARRSRSSRSLSQLPTFRVSAACSSAKRSRPSQGTACGAR